MFKIGVPSWIIIVAISAIIDATISYYLKKLRNKNLEEMYSKMEKEYKWIEHKSNIRGYITKEFSSQDSYKKFKTIKGNEVNIDKHFAFFLETERTGFKILESNENEKSKKGDYYIFYTWGADHTTGILTYLKLKKDEKNVLRYDGMFSESVNKSNSYEAIYTEIPNTSYLSLEKNMLYSIMEIISKIQQGYEALQENLNFIYVNGSKIEKSNNIPTTEIVPYEKENGNAVLNEHVFLPFIQKEGSIKNEIREE